jgi:hypothetical protein
MLKLESGIKTSEDEEIEQIQGSGRGLQATGTLTVVVKHDNFPLETAWLLTEGPYDLWFQNAGSVYTPGAVVSQSFTVTAGEFVFQIIDTDFDGICCQYGEGYWALYLDGYLFYQSYFVNGYGEQISFFVG